MEISTRHSAQSSAHELQLLHVSSIEFNSDVSIYTIYNPILAFHPLLSEQEAFGESASAKVLGRQESSGVDAVWGGKFGVSRESGLTRLTSLAPAMTIGF